MDGLMDYMAPSLSDNACIYLNITSISWISIQQWKKNKYGSIYSSITKRSFFPHWIEQHYKMIWYIEIKSV